MKTVYACEPYEVREMWNFVRIVYRGVAAYEGFYLSMRSNAKYSCEILDVVSVWVWVVGTQSWTQESESFWSAETRSYQ